jgi:hypothetical protein
MSTPCKISFERQKLAGESHSKGKPDKSALNGSVKTGFSLILFTKAGLTRLHRGQRLGPKPLRFRASISEDIDKPIFSDDLSIDHTTYVGMAVEACNDGNEFQPHQKKHISRLQPFPEGSTYKSLMSLRQKLF